MTTTQLLKMRAGREAQLARQRAADLAKVADYREWVKLERECYTKLLAIREDDDGTVASRKAIAEAQREWSSALTMMPGDLPSDSSPAWQS